MFNECNITFIMDDNCMEIHCSMVGGFACLITTLGELPLNCLLYWEIHCVFI